MKKVKIKYKASPYELRISCDNKSFNTSRISDLTVSEWAFPFHKDDIEWKGLYEELKAFTQEDEFVVQFDGDKPDYETLKFALENTKAKLISSNNSAVIIYSENPFTTKINVNGVVFDTSRIQNRSIEEWIKPIEQRGLEWRGIFQELEEYIGTDEYNIQFMGDQEFMKPLMDACPSGVNVTYRMPLKQEKKVAAAGAGTSSGTGFIGAKGKTNNINDTLNTEVVDTESLNWTGLLLIFIGNLIDLFIGFGFVLSLIGMVMLAPSNEIFNKAKNSFIKSVITSVAGGIVLVSLAFPLISAYILGASSIYELRLRASGAGPLVAFIILTAAISITAYIFNKDSYKHLLEGCKGIAAFQNDTSLAERCIKSYRHYRTSLLIVTITSIAFSVILIGIATMIPAFWVIGMIIWFVMLGSQIYLLVAKILVIICVWKTYKYKNS